MQACNIGTCDDGRIESTNRISGHCSWGLEQVTPTIFFFIVISYHERISFFNCMICFMTGEKV